MKTVKRIIVVLFVLIIAFFATIYFLPKDSSKNKKPEVKINATALYNSFVEDEALATKDYLGKIVLVEGTIADIDKDAKNATVIFLKSDDPVAGVLCTLEEGEERKLPSDAIGSAVTIKGVCTGKLMDVVLNKCIVEK